MKRNEDSEGDDAIHTGSCKAEPETAPKRPFVPSKALITKHSQYSWHWALGAALGRSCMAADNTDFRDKGLQLLILNSSPVSLSKAELQARGRWLCSVHRGHKLSECLNSSQVVNTHPGTHQPSMTGSPPTALP